MHCMPTPMKYKPPVLNCFKHFTEQNNDIKNNMIKATIGTFCLNINYSMK